MTDAEFLSMLQQLVEVMRFIRDNTGKHFTDVKPDNLRFDHLTGKVKLFDIGLYNPDTRSGYLNMLRNAESRSALTRKQLACLQARQVHVEESDEKVAIFQLGISLLAIFANKPLEYLYDYRQCSLRVSRLQECMQAMRFKGYSRMAVGCLGNFLNEHEADRPDFESALMFVSRQTR